MTGQQNRPRTIEELAALPEGGGFGMTEEVVDSKTIRRPVAPDLVAIFDDGSPMRYVDANGVRWVLGCSSDGRWFRMRRP